MQAAHKAGGRVRLGSFQLAWSLTALLFTSSWIYSVPGLDDLAKRIDVWILDNLLLMPGLRIITLDGTSEDSVSSTTWLILETHHAWRKASA